MTSNWAELNKRAVMPYPHRQSLPQTPVDPDVELQEQNMPSSSRRLLIFLVRYISWISQVSAKPKLEWESAAKIFKHVMKTRSRLFLSANLTQFNMEGLEHRIHQ